MSGEELVGLTTADTVEESRPLDAGRPEGQGSQRWPRPLHGVLLAGGLVVVLAGLRATAGIIGPAMLALILTITVNPIRRPLVRRGAPQWLASVVVVVVVYALVLGVTLSVVLALGRFAALLPSYTAELNASVRDAGTWLQQHGVGSQQVTSMASAIDVGNVVQVASGVFGAVLSFASGLFFVGTMALFMGLDTPSTQRVLRDVQASRSDLVGALATFAHATRTYMAVSAGFGLIVAVIDGVALWLMGVPGAFVWAVLAFVTNFVPNIGFVIGVIPPAVIGLLEGGPGLMLGVLVVYSLINVVVQSIIQPRYVGDAVGLTPTLTMLSLVFWAWLIGPLGALLAVPLSLLARALLVEADPQARWALPLVSGRPSTEEVGA